MSAYRCVSVFRDYSAERRRELVEEWKESIPWKHRDTPGTTYKIETMLENDGPIGEIIVKRTPEILEVLDKFFVNKYKIPGAYHHVLIKISELEFNNITLKENWVDATPNLLQNMDARLDDYEGVLKEMDRVLLDRTHKPVYKNNMQALKRRYERGTYGGLKTSY